MSSNALAVVTHPNWMSQYQQFIHMSRYSRFLDGVNRREFWPETVGRYVEYFRKRVQTRYPQAYPFFEQNGIFEQLEAGIAHLESMPSMRALMTAGPALDRDNMAAYNCSYSSTDAKRAFDEIVYILMCGTGNGFTVERQFVAHLPVVGAYVRQTEDGHVADVHTKFIEIDHTIVVRDSKTGWADSYRQLLNFLWDGQIPKWDVSKVRPAGARLKTFGGRASGPDPLVRLFKFTISVFKNALGRRLTSIEVHDIICFIADIVVVGGVRRSALISLSNLSDDRMRNAKNGNWWEQHKHRGLANNSTAYTEKPDFEVFLKEWFTLYESRSGERGIFNRVAAKRKVARHGRRDPNHEFGTNPCFVGETLVAVADGRNAVRIDELAASGETFDVYSAVPRSRRSKAIRGGGSQSLSAWKTVIRQARAVESGVKSVVRVVLDNGDTFECTGDHKLALASGGWVSADQSEGLRLDAFASFKVKNYRTINSVSSNKQHVLMFKNAHGDIPAGHHVDHIERSVGDYLDNLQLLTAEDHYAKTAEEFAEDNPVGGTDADHLSAVQAHRSFLHRNGRYCGLSDQDLLRIWKKAGVETRADLMRVSVENGGPSSLSKNRFGAWADLGYESKFDYIRALLAGDCEYVAVEDYTEDVEFRRDQAYSRTETYADWRYRVKKNGDLKYVGVKVLRVTKLRKTVPVYDVQVMLPEDENTYDNRSFYIITGAEDDAAVTSRGVLVHNCGEIILRPYGLCNLSEVVVRPDDEEASLLAKITNATILGTLQSTLTDFRYVRDIWRKNAEEERLLGVSLTGIFDNPLMYDISTPEKEQALRDRLDRFREHAIAVNAQYADLLGINHSAAITTIKPSGTVSQLVNCSSGIHPGYSEFYIRRVRADMKDPLAQYLMAAGVPYEEDVMKPGIGVVFSFPQKSAPNALLRDQVGAMGQIKLYQIYKDHWCEHNPSITVYYRDHEFLEIGNWIYNNFEDVGGISFLPHSDHVYVQPPYEEITAEQYEALCAQMPHMDWARLQEFEKEDNTSGQQTLACTGNVCELVDLSGS